MRDFAGGTGLFQPFLRFLTQQAQDHAVYITLDHAGTTPESRICSRRSLLVLIQTSSSVRATIASACTRSANKGARA